MESVARTTEMDETLESSSTTSSTAESGEESKFAAVVFHNIQEIYVPGKDIRCCYSIKPSVSPTPNDWIGLFKVGWQSHKDYLCYEYSPMIVTAVAVATASLSLQNSVLFRGGKLPSEENEFYQFCYVTSDGEIRGASYPFQIQFTKPGELECSEEEGEDGDTMLVVRNRTTMLEDSLAKAYDENTALKASKEKLEAESLSFQDMILELESQKNELHTRLKKNDKAIAKAVCEKHAVEAALHESVEKVKHSEQGLREARTRYLELQKSLEVEKLRSVQAESKTKLEEEVMQLLQVISDGQREIDRLNVMVDKKNSEIAALEEKILKMAEENKALVEEHDNILREINTTQVSLEKAEQSNLAMEKSLAEKLEVMSILKKENCELKEELTAAHDKMDGMSKESDLAQQTHLKAINCIGEQTETLKREMLDKDRAINIVEEKIQDIVCELEQEKAMQQQLIQEYEDSLSNIQEQLNQERAFNNSLSTASDRQVAELQEQLNIQLERNGTACKQIDIKIQEIKRLEEDVKAKEKVVVSMERRIDEGKQDLESAKNLEHTSLQSKENKVENNAALEGPYFALQKAHVHLKKQHLQVKADMENLWRQKSDLRRQLTALQSELPDSDIRFQMANLKKQIEDLRIRLNMGAEAYKAKFKECRKYQSQLKKVQKNVSGKCSPQSPSSVSEFEIRNLKQSLENEKTSVDAIKKSMENDVCEAKQELEEIKKESEILRKKISKLEEDAAVTKEEKERRLAEDKELQSHIACLHSKLKTQGELVKNADEGYKKAAEEKENVIATLTEKNQSLQDAMEKVQEVNETALGERDVLQEVVVRYTQSVEDLSSQMQEKDERIEALLQRICELELNADETSNSEQVITSAPHQVDDSSSRDDPGFTFFPNEVVCPVCNIYFPPNCPEVEFTKHVNSHFDKDD